MVSYVDSHQTGTFTNFQALISSILLEQSKPKAESLFTKNKKLALPIYIHDKNTKKRRINLLCYSILIH